ncbi:MAG: glycosyltransferase [Succinivibrio sp.]|nr:glycosyltransferase [Succinivibrio sp.]
MNSLGSIFPHDIPEICREFSRKFKALRGVMCFMLDFMPDKSPDGLEMAVLRRADLFSQYLECEPLILTNLYQHHFAENSLHQREFGRVSAMRVINLYDYLQGIDRSPTAPSSEPELPYIDPEWKCEEVKDSRDLSVKDAAGRQLMYINRDNRSGRLVGITYFTGSQVSRRDNYDVQGFLSRIEFVDQKSNFPSQRIYLRPDHTVALVERPKPGGPGPNGNADDDAITVMNRKGQVIQQFVSHTELTAFWLLSMLRDPNCFYLLLFDRAGYYQRTFQELAKRRDAYSNLRVICQAHASHASEPLARLGYNFRYIDDRSMRVDGVVTLTERQKADIERRLGGNTPWPITSIPHFLPPKHRINDNNGTVKVQLPPKSIIMVGRLDGGKQPNLALQAFAEVAKAVPDASLHFLGKGPDEQSLRQQAAALNLTERVVFHGFVSDLSSVYRQAALMFLCSRSEGFSLVILEALSYGCPCVSFDCRYGPDTMITDDLNGYLVPPGDTAALAQKAIAILKDNALRDKLSAGALESLEKFSPPSVASRWADFLLEILPKTPD